ncbi:MAG: 16S rRNA (adenine(1518)-N(6)/adenine(1519)-N(6))-dimethyltransferase RsmA [Saprospiraceae bacterium]|nr:16S rRNA (adenine(1518)-N(6)/adenine(1519)-N(6))-dimethyltransferase RsmA [Saprospiraceae bacterium]MDW8483854.1 16S rRNA (adenine(1518)-N(6)/adenine(1519)-N(6))-dimethyltransferase RsmA [Saprospiraceae bacterium]
MRPKKSYGQHFLKNDHTAARIVAALQRAIEVGHVLEVGPGMGILTRHLLARSEQYVTYAVEADADMVDYLRKHLPQLGTRLIRGDFLAFNPTAIWGDQPFCLIGNFPYNISTQILFWVLNFRGSIPEVVGMFQKEVADRIAATPGTRIYGITSVLVQAYYNVEMLFTLERGAFEPPPTVRSAVIRLTRKDGFELQCREETFRRLVKTAFNQRRKMLRNTLKEFFPAEQLYRDAFFEKRPEMLSWTDFEQLGVWYEANK